MAETMNIKAEKGEQLPWHDAWRDVDRTSDPSWFVKYLDSIRADKIKQVEDNPEQFFAYLNVCKGQHVLEVGCGTGDLLPALAYLVGPRGRVVGIDKSRIMIAEAAQRATRTQLPIECQQGDAHRLDFPSNTFDVCFTSAVLQHIPGAAGALSEMVRVVRPGGRIAVTEHDWETQIIASDDPIATRKILNFFCDEICNGWIGRQLRGMFQQLGLQEIVVTPTSFVSADYTRTAEKLDFDALIERAQIAGIISPDQGKRWLMEMEQRGRDGTFFRSLTIFRVCGYKPYPVFL